MTPNYEAKQDSKDAVALTSKAAQKRHSASHIITALGIALIGLQTVAHLWPQVPYVGYFVAVAGPMWRAWQHGTADLALADEIDPGA